MLNKNFIINSCNNSSSIHIIANPFNISYNIINLNNFNLKYFFSLKATFTRIINVILLSIYTFEKQLNLLI